ncbi:GNAT family N-acetyltransferase [Clostridium felsineum]|uniref:GNAT family N-acetyltransferase n=1 Tax=Clostridium felsineum TaxID=36839 RepID=UPI00214DAAF0|nr:GNAT family N-acetyltransferase [Clostridium felsineum]MCR3760660.1 GNAT family N-acetyltransferase [Clostridium felsineum]
MKNISLMPITSVDKSFIFKIFKESREYLNLSEDMLLRQFKLEENQLIENNPKAQFNIIFFENMPVGRMYIKCDKEYHILELGILRGYRKMGIGRKVMSSYIELSIKNKKSLSLNVLWFNQGAFEFYKNLGFKMIKNEGILFKMQYTG